MKKLFTLIAISAIVTSCAQSGEQSQSLDDLDLFLASVEEENKIEGPIASSAYWIGSNFITYDSQKVVADYGKRNTFLQNSKLCMELENIVMKMGHVWI